MPALVAPGRAPRPGDRGAHLRRLRGRRLHQPRLPALRHHQLPGLRRDVGGGLLDQRGRPRATAGQIRTYRGAPAFTQFSASSGGWTSDGGKPYLPAQKDPYDGWPGNGVHTWSTTVTSGAIEKAWPSLGNLTGITVTKRDGHGQWNGRVVIDDAPRQQQRRRPQRRRLPARSRSALHLVQPRRGHPHGAGALGWCRVDRRARPRSTTSPSATPTARPRWCRPCAPTRPVACDRRTTTPPSWRATSTSRRTATSPAPARGSATSPIGRIPSSPARRSCPRSEPCRRRPTWSPSASAATTSACSVTSRSVCPAVAQAQPKGAPCRRHFTDAHGVNTKYRDARRIRSHVAAGLRAVHRAAPHAHVVVVGYPRLLPTKGTCAAAPFATGDYAFARRVGILLNRSLRLAATAHHATYVEHLRRLAGPRRVRRPPGVGQRPAEHRDGCGVPPLREGGAGDGPARLPRADRRRRTAGRRRDAAPGSVILNRP